MTHPSFGWRWLKLCLDKGRGSGEATIRLMWAEARADDRVPPKPGQRGAPAYNNSCDLAHIQVVAHGHAARAPPLLDYSAGAPVECSFSVITRKRSFDFVCENEKDCEAFVVLLSRLCHRIQGWPVLGNIATPAKFQAAKGWCKVQSASRKACTPMKHMVKQALKLTAEQRGIDPELVQSRFDQDFVLRKKAEQKERRQVAADELEHRTRLYR